jgi:adenosylcobinamide-GDP ribazoletransferase
MRGFSAALSFLTRIPSYRVVPHDTSDLAGATMYFPLVGIVVGASGAVVFGAGVVFWPPALAAVLSVGFTVWLTGAFHEDALADSLDGFGGGWHKSQVLEIMKDSRVGSYALVGVVLVLAAKLSSLVTLFNNAHVPTDALHPVLAVTRSLVAAHVLARWSSVLLMRSSPYVRVEQAAARPSAGQPFAQRATTAATTIATVTTLTIVTVALQGRAVAAIAAALIITWLARRYFHRRIGGITGDALGAANQLVELSVYLVLAARTPIG